jgi:putative transport protein
LFSFLTELRGTQPVTHALLVLSVASVLGLAFGKARYRGLGLGTAGTLFSGLLLGHWGQAIDSRILEFVKDFGLVLFVFTIGLRLGPGFAASLRRQGLRLNAMAAAIVITGAGLAAAAVLWPARLDPAASAGLFCGATTNTPALGAVKQTLRSLPAFPDDRQQLPALAYAVAYPVGIVGLIGSLLLLKWWFRIDPVGEAAELARRQASDTPPLERRSLTVRNPNLDGVAVVDLPGLRELSVNVSRILPRDAEVVRAVGRGAAVRVGDTLQAVGTPANLDQFQRIVGERSSHDLMVIPGNVAYRRVIVTRREVLGVSLAELDLPQRHNITVTRLLRAEFELPAVGGLRLQFGDVLHLVGAESDLDVAARELGNSAKAINETQFLAVFAGLACGIAVGLLPLSLPGLPQPVRLGLAGGPLLIAILGSRAGHWGPLVWHMPPTANQAFRELGITLFLACIGLEAGSRFFALALSFTGLAWIAAAVVITMAPLLVVGGLARCCWRIDFATLSGVLSGSLTDPPALAFATGLCKSEAPSIGYATVYPAAMLLRVTAAQIVTLTLVSGTS